MTRKSQNRIWADSHVANWRQVGTSWVYVQLDMSPKVVAVCFQGRRSRRVRSRFVRGSREISLVPSLHRASTDTLIGTMKVTEHYTHTFEKLHSVSIRAHFWSDKLVWSQGARISKIALSVNELFKNVSFQNSSSSCCAFSFNNRNSKTRYGDETMHKDRNSWPVVQECLHLYVNINASLYSTLFNSNCFLN